MIQPEEVGKIRVVDNYEYEHPESPRSLYNTLTAGAATTTFFPIESDCKMIYHAVHDSGERPLSEIIWIVLHSTEGDTAEGAARWFTNPASKGSTHLVVDDNVCYRTLMNGRIPWGAKGANYRGFHIEQAGYARWLTSIWSTKHRNTLKRAAYKTAYHCRLFGIPPYFVDRYGLELGKAGVTTHAECTKAFGGNHTDPGSGWPRYTFMTLVRYYYNGVLKNVTPIA